MSDIDKLLEIVARLRDPRSGCPWDQQQTFDTIAPYTIEEAYEVADAIARRNSADLADELGDLLFQVVFHARMAEEDGAFTFADVVSAICDKMRRRHPHVFGSDEQRAAGASPGSWERIKSAERRESQASGVLAGIPAALPALKRAEKLGKRAAAVGFDWPDESGVRAKVAEELRELDEAISTGDPRAVEEELGDLLFSIANFARHRRLDPEKALSAANRKFSERFEGMETAAAESGQSLAERTLDDLEALWAAQKQR